MTRFQNNLHQIHTLSEPKYLKARLPSLGTRKPKGLNRIAKISYGHLCPRKERILVLIIT
jgi:hypothetical protein